jgi:ABC-2 type transport system permease protein
MSFRNINIIIAREYLNKVKKKSFLVTTILVPILFVVFMVIMTVIMSNVKEREQSVAVVDQSGIVFPFLENNDRVTFEDFSGEPVDTVKNNLDALGKDALVVISPLDTAARMVNMSLYSKDPAGVEFTDNLKNMASNAVEDYRIKLYNIEDLEKIMEDVKADVPLTEYTLDEEGNAAISESGIYMMISLILGIIIFMFISMFGGQVMSAVIEEKSSRVIEVLVSSVNAIDLMFGKIIGIALVALTQFLLWIVLTFGIGALVGAFMGADKLKEFTQNPEMMAQTMGVSPEQMQSFGVGADTASIASADSLTAPASDAQIIISTLMNVPWTKLIIAFLVFFFLGYLLYSSMFAAIGSAVENEGDSQQLQLPLTIPLILAYLVVFMLFQNPDSSVVKWCSWIPFTSPIVMPARIPYGVSNWEIWGSVAVLFVTFVIFAWISAKIYKSGILVFGKKSTFKDLWKYFKQG